MESKYLQNLPQIDVEDLEGAKIIKIFGSILGFDDYTIITNRGYVHTSWYDEDEYYQESLTDGDLFVRYYTPSQPFKFTLTTLGQWLNNHGYLKDYSEIEESCRKNYEESKQKAEVRDRHEFERLKEQYGWS